MSHGAWARRSLAGIALLVVACVARARTIIDLSWRDLAESADFVGVVECTTAGGLVAKYRVIEAWKGTEEPGAEVAIAQAVDFWGTQPPLSLVGERSLITAYRPQTPTHVVVSSSRGVMPLSWRRIPADYHLPAFQGVVRLPATGRWSMSGVGSERMRPSEVRQDIVEFLAQDAATRELGYLKDEAAAMRKRAPVRAILDACGPVLRAESLEAAVKPLARRWKLETAREPWLLINLLGQLRPEGRKIVRAMPPSELGGPAARAALLAMWPDDARHEREHHEQPTTTRSIADATLARIVASLELGVMPDDFLDSLDMVLERAPAAVVAWLTTWTNEPAEWFEENRGYEVGSYVGWAVRGDRRKHLASLLSAKDPFVATAAAIYLAMEDEAWGLAALREATLRPGDSGAWAALTLARRGERAFVARALEAFEPLATRSWGQGSAEWRHEALQDRILELTSNSARHAGLPQPRWGRDPHAAAIAWWAAHPDVVPYDPWLPMLLQQKVD